MTNHHHSYAIEIVIETKISKSDLFPPIFALNNTYNWTYSEKIREGKRFAYWTEASSRAHSFVYHTGRLKDRR